VTKLLGPMLNITASGNFEGGIQFMRYRGDVHRKVEERSGVAYARVNRFPTPQKTPRWIAARATLSAGVCIWRDESSMGAESRNAWDASASGLAMSGFNRYLQVFILNNPQREPPWVVPSPQ
jgi:hypothetical protein